MAKSKITMDLKTTLVIMKKRKIVKKLKEKFGEGEYQVEEVEIKEGVEGEEANEALEKKKRKTKTPISRKPRKVARPNSIVPSTKARKRATTKKDQE